MNRKIRVYRAITYIVLFYAAAAFFLLGRCGILKKDRTVAGTEVPAGTVQVRMDQQVQQVFLAEGTYLRYLDLYMMSGDPGGESYHLYIYDENNEVLLDRALSVPEPTPEQELPGFMRFAVGVRTVPGTAYVWQMGGMTAVPMDIAFENTGETGLTAFGNYYVVHDGETQMHEAQNIVMRLTYTDSPSGRKMLLLYAGIALAAAAAILWAETRGRLSRRLSEEIRVQNVLQLTLGPTLLAALVYLVSIIFIQKAFGGKADDRLVYALGLGAAAVCIALFLFGKRKGENPTPFRRLAAERGMDWLQAACFAGILWSSVDYMNARYQIWQDLACRKMLFWVCLLLLTMGSLRAVWNRKGIAWCLLCAAAGAGYFLYCRFGMQKQGPELSLAAYEALIAAAAGPVLLSLWDKFRGRRFETAGLNRPYAVFLAVFMGLLVVFRNTRGWPIYLAVVFGCFYLFYAGWENRRRLLPNFCSGIILHFVTALIFAMARRPYRSLLYHRYNFIFHTVTVTAYYLALVICALTVRLLVQTVRKAGAVRILETLVLYGMAMSLLFFTMSRTGFLAVAAVVVGVVPFAVLFCFRRGPAALGGTVLSMAAAFLVCLPMTYTGIRILPALYNDPYIFEIEESPIAVHRDEAKDSSNYMSVSYLRYMIGIKLLGVPQNWGEEEDFSLHLGDTIYVEPGSVLVAAQGDAGLGDIETFSNGRMEIFRRYIRAWNLFGHDGMGVELADGSISLHAHNVYLQVIHDHGLLVGIVFLLMGAVSLGMMAAYALRKGTKDPYAVLPLAVTVVFAAAGLVEWLFHPCNPMGFSLMTVLAPLLYSGKRTERQTGGGMKKKDRKVSE